MKPTAGDLGRRRVLDGRPIAATYSYRHPAFSVTAHSIIRFGKLGLAPSTSSVVNLPLCFRDLYAPILDYHRTRGTRTPSTLLPLLNRTHLCSSAARSLWTAKSCHGPSFTSESEAWLEPIQPSGCDSSAKGCGASRGLGSRGGFLVVLKQIHCRPETKAIVLLA